MAEPVERIDRRLFDRGAERGTEREYVRGKHALDMDFGTKMSWDRVQRTSNAGPELEMLPTRRLMRNGKLRNLRVVGRRHEKTPERSRRCGRLGRNAMS